MLYAIFNHPHRKSRFSGSRKLSSCFVLTGLSHTLSGVKVVGERYNGTGEEHPADPLHSLDNLKSQSASVAFYRSSKAYSGWSGAVTEWPVVVSSDRFPRY